MERSLLRIIRSQVDHPNVSILLPTHKTAPDNRQDKMLIKRLFREAKRRLIAEFKNHQIKSIISKLNKISAGIDVRKNLDGLAIFVNNRFEKVVRLPFPVTERVIIDESFATRDLIRAVNRNISYYTLSVSASFVRLFEAYRDNFSEITESGFPFVNPLPRKSNYEESTSVKDNRLKEFFNMVDKSFGLIYNQHPMPVVLAGLGRNIALYGQVSNFTDRLITTVEGNYNETSVHDIARTVWPEVRQIMAEKRRQELNKIDDAQGKKRVVSGIEEVWKLAHEGRGELLIVEENFHQAVRAGLNGFPATTDDIVDEIAEKVISTGGRVVFAENGSMSKYDHIVLRLKY